MEQQPAPPTVADEMTQLTAYLQRQRDLIRRRTTGLDAEQLSARLDPSTMTLGGLLTHLAYVEDHWLGELVAGDPPAPPWDAAAWEQDEDWDWHLAAGQGAEALLAQWEASTQRADAVLEGRSPEDHAAVGTREGTAMNVRYVLLHLIEEYARHAGHADILRESIDGTRGDRPA